MDFKDDTDADLLFFMAARDDDPAGAKTAWAEFYERHLPYIYWIARRAADGLLARDYGVEDLVQETFRRAFEHAGSFSAGDVSDPERIRRLVRGWLAVIGTNVLRDIRKLQARLPIDGGLDGDDSALAVSGNPEAESESSARMQDLALVEEAIHEALTERERAVIQEIPLWHDRDTGVSRMPRGAAAELARQLGTVSDNLRQIKRRSREKIRAYVEERRSSEEQRGL